MKRLFALLLVVAMLLSLCVLPASAADEQSKMSVASFTTYTYDTDTNNVTIGEPKTTPYEKGDLVAVKVTFHNAEEKAIQLTSIQMVMEYDRSAVEPVFWKDPDFGTVYGYAVAASTFGMSLQANEIEAGKVKLGGASAGVKVAAGATVDVAYYLFKVKSEVEAGDAGFALEISELTKRTTSGKESIKDSVLLEGNSVPVAGNPPELDSVSIDRPTIEYGSAETLKLTATSTSGKDITSLVKFGVKNASGTDVTTSFAIAVDGTLSIGTHDAGTYTVDASPKDGKCTLNSAFAPQATFEITQKKIASPAVAVVRFVKGNYLMNLQNQTISMDVTTTTPGLKVGFTCYEGTDTSGNPLQNPYQLKAGTLYSIVIGLGADTNYELDATKLKVTVNDGAEQEVDIVASGFAGAYKAIVTAETESAETPTITNMAEISAVYGDKLSAHTTELSGTVTNAADETVTGTFTWVDDADTTTVGTVGSHEFTVNFTPDDLFNYAPTTAKVTVNVTKKQITFNSSDYAWRAMNGEETVTQPGKGIVFTYDGKEHGIEPYCTNDSIKDFVQFEYDSVYNRHTSVNTIGATVRANVVAANDNCEIVGDVKQLSGDWALLAKTIDFTGEYTANVQACYSVTSHTVTLDKFGLPNEVTSDPNTTYTLRDNKVIVDNDVLDVNSVAYENGTLRFNLVSGLSDTAVGTKASIMFGLYVNNYKTNHAAVTGISTGTEANLFILKADITLIAKGIDAETMTVEVPNAEYGVGVTPKVTGKPDSVDALDFVYTNTETKQTYTQDTIMNAPAGSYTLKVTGQDDSTIYEATATFTITQRDISKENVATVTFGPQLTYNGKEQPQTMTVKVGDTSLTADDYELATESAVLTQKDAGEYKVIINGKGNYTGTKEATFTIAKATPAVSDFTFKAPADLTYDGNPKTATVTAKKDEIGTVNISYNPADPTNAGEYKVKISTAATKNYEAVTDLTADDWKFTISQKAVTVTVTAQGKTYDGTDTATITGTLNNVLEQDEANVTLNTPRATFASKNAGEQTITVNGKFTLSGTAAGNYVIDPEPVLNSLKATIAKKPLEALADLTADVRYDNLTEQTVTVPAPEGLISGDEQYVTCVITRVDTGDKRLESAPGYENGKITFQLKDKQEKTAQLKYKVTLDYGDNYANKVVTYLYINISIRAAQSTLTYTGATSVAYDQSITLTSAGGSGTGAVTYAVVGGDGAATISGNVLTATKAGTVKIQVTKAGDKDYLATTSAVYDITVTKATPATPPEIKVDNTDTTLGELGRDMVNKIGVPGTIHWNGPDGKPITDPDNTKIEANKEYSWTFVPTDSDNYSEIKGTTTPYVRDDLSWLPGVLGGGSSFSFHDVNRFDYYYDSVKWAADNGIASGTSRFTFSPDAVCTRAQTVTFLWRAAGSPLPRYRACPFTDVHSYDYYYEAVLWAVEQGITTGLTATTFGPDETVTRGQVATFLYRAASAAKPNTFNPFTDVKPTAYNYDAILWAYDNRITTGTSTTTFSADAFCTRAQIVTFLYRYYQGR